MGRGSERYVFVVPRRDVNAAADRCGCASAGGAAAAEVSGFVCHRSTAAGAQELHAHRDDLSDLALASAVLRFILAIRNSPLDVNGLPFFEILGAVLALLAPYNDVVPVVPIMSIAALVIETFLGRDVKVSA